MWTLFTLVQGSPLIWVLWSAGVLGAVALTIGFRTRLAALVVFVVMMSVSRSAPLAFNAGDGLLRVIAFYLLLMPAGSAVSVDRWRADPGACGPSLDARRGRCGSRRSSSASSTSPPSGRRRAAEAGATARRSSYAVRIGEVGRLPVPSFVTNSPLLTELATYGTVAAELAIGVLVWNRAARPWVLALGVLLHLSIELTLAVGFFSVDDRDALSRLPPTRACRAGPVVGA